MSSSPTEQRAAMEALQSELSSRKSILHFAHAAVSTVLVLMLGGTAWSLTRIAPLEGASLVLSMASAAFALYAVVRLGFGLRHFKVEAARFEDLKALRVRLGVDDPAALLPREP